MFKENFNKVAYLIHDNLNQREPFKVRLVSDQGMFYTQNIGGLVDTGRGLVLSTWKNIKYKSNLRVLFEGILYSVESITPFIPDAAEAGFRKKHSNTEYILNLK